MFTALALANLFGHLLGAKGKIFIFEMDEVVIGDFSLFSYHTFR